MKPINYIVVTDGAASTYQCLPGIKQYTNRTIPADDPADVIVNAARRLDKGGFLLSQV